MTKIVEDAELLHLRAMADGSKPFEASPLWEKVAALDRRELLKLDARTRLGVGYYMAAVRRAEQMRDAA